MWHSEQIRFSIPTHVSKFHFRCETHGSSCSTQSCTTLFSSLLHVEASLLQSCSLAVIKPISACLHIACSSLSDDNKPAASCRPAYASSYLRLFIHKLDACLPQQLEASLKIASCIESDLHRFDATWWSQKGWWQQTRIRSGAFQNASLSSVSHLCWKTTYAWPNHVYVYNDRHYTSDLITLTNHAKPRRAAVQGIEVKNKFREAYLVAAIAFNSSHFSCRPSIRALMASASGLPSSINFSPRSLTF